MNSDLMRWLLDVEVIPRDTEAASLRLGWEHPWDGWIWALAIAGAGFFAIWSYNRLSGWRLGRGILAATRFLLLALILVLISGPTLELPRETVEEDWVLVLADRSASMAIRDVAAVNGEGLQSPARIARDAQLRATLQRHDEVFRALAQERHLVWLGFHSGVFSLQSERPKLDPADSGVDLGDASGSRTNIEMALEQALQRAAARPISGVVLLSDGRSEARPGRGVVRRLQDEKIPVFAVPLGSAEPLGDLAVRSVEAPKRAFVRDKVPVIVELDRLGSGANDNAVVRLVDTQTGAELDRAEIQPATQPGEPDRLTLTAEPALAGDATWQVVIETSGGQMDLVPENNARSMMIELVDRPLQVLFVEGYPRWEYRFVKELIRREKSIESSVMLISADRDFAQEGNIPITRLPRSPEEFAQYDMIILGDVPATFFSPEQLEMMRNHVADRGAGLLWIAGERSTPSTYSGTAVADLLPMRGSLNLPAINEAVTMNPTPLAERLGIMQLVIGSAVGWPRELMDPSFGWSQLQYAQRIEPGQLKPTAEVLAQTYATFNGTALPLVLSMRYGAGQSIYVATDETWRWRYGRGELLHEQFWLQIIRMLGRESLESGGGGALEINPRQLAVNQLMRIEVRLLDASLADEQRTSIRAVIEAEDGSRVAELELRRVEGSEDRFGATYMPDVTGPLRVRVDDPTLARLNLTAAAEVFAPDDELRQPETDHELLADLAAATGGRVLKDDELQELPRLLPNREVRSLNPLTEPIWDSPLAFALVLLLITFEWIGRKVLRLA